MVLLPTHKLLDYSSFCYRGTVSENENYINAK